MSLWDVCIRRPVFTCMLVAMPIVLGVASYMRLNVEFFPNADVPVVVVTTLLRGASVEEMETSVTRVIEEAVNSVPGIDEMRSSTREGHSQVVVSFKIERNGDVAAQEVDAKIRTVLSQLPVGTETPLVDKVALDSAPIMSIAVSGRRDVREVTELARRRIKERLEILDGVGAVGLVGGRVRAVEVILDPERMMKYDGLTIEDVRRALARENAEQPGGRVTRGGGERGVRVPGRVVKPEELNKLVVATIDGQPVRVEDIGRVADGTEEPRGDSHLWVRAGDAGDNLDAPADSAVTLVLQKRSGANTVTVAAAVRKTLAEVAAALPADMRVEIIRDQSRFVELSLHEVQTHLLLAAALVSGSILLFLRDWRTTLIAMMSIPTSIIGVFALMDVMGFSINVFTMLGLILAVGIVVDDAVVVHENIFRHMEELGRSPQEAASLATREIALAVLATTLSLLVIFAPIAFMGGMVGRFLSSFGWVVGFAVALSWFVSMTLTPMLCSRFLKHNPGHSSKGGWVWRLVEGVYMAILGWSLRHRLVVAALALGFLMSTPAIAARVGMAFVPKDDQSEFELVLTMPEGYSLDRVNRVVSDIERRMRPLRGVTHVFSTIGDTSGKVTKGQGEVTAVNIYVRLVDISVRPYSQFDVMEDARVVMADYPDLRGAVQAAEPVQAQGIKQVDLDLNLTGPDMPELVKLADKVTAHMRDSGKYIDIDTNIAARKPELRVLPDRERLADLGGTLDALASTTKVLIGGDPVSKYKERDEQYDVWLRAEPESRADVDVIGRIGVPAPLAPGKTARLDSLAVVEESFAPGEILRFARTRQVVVNANLKGIELSEAVADINAFLKTLEMPPGAKAVYLGDAKMLQESNDNFAFGFLLAFIFMYMILAAQFESFTHPVAILSALPLTIPSAMLSLWLMRTPLDLYAMLGLFMLFGIIKKNGILQVDSANQLRKAGLPRDAALLEANRVRLRPILMTTVMLVAAMVPMALSQGPGASTRASMAKVILGGQIVSLLITLLITPVAYSLIDSAGLLWKRVTGRA